jgi:hypothetical protein
MEWSFLPEATLSTNKTLMTTFNNQPNQTKPIPTTNVERLSEATATIAIAAHEEMLPFHSVPFATTNNH